MASWRSVHNHNCRIKKSKEQYDLPSPREVDIFELTIECMNQLGLDTGKLKKIDDVKKRTSENRGFDREFYDGLMSDYELADFRDIIWMKFTKGKRHLGVVATSDDINFDIPVSNENYNDKKENGTWQYLSSGIIIHLLGEIWNEDYVFVFPLINKVPDIKRQFYEKQIGDYLIEKGIPILDYYSHRI